MACARLRVAVVTEKKQLAFSAHNSLPTPLGRAMMILEDDMGLKSIRKEANMLIVRIFKYPASEGQPPCVALSSSKI